MAKKYYGKEGKKMKSGGNAGLPSELVMKSYPKSPYGGNLGNYRDSQPECDAFGQMAVSKLRKQKLN